MNRALEWSLVGCLAAMMAACSPTADVSEAGPDGALDVIVVSVLPEAAVLEASVPDADAGASISADAGAPDGAWADSAVDIDSASDATVGTDAADAGVTAAFDASDACNALSPGMPIPVTVAWDAGTTPSGGAIVGGTYDLTMVAKVPTARDSSCAMASGTAQDTIAFYPSSPTAGTFAEARFTGNGDAGPMYDRWSGTYATNDDAGLSNYAVITFTETCPAEFKGSTTVWTSYFSTPTQIEWVNPGDQMYIGTLGSVCSIITAYTRR